jgi:hypothetical protein
MSSECAWDRDWEGISDDEPPAFKPMVVRTAPDESPSAQRRSVLGAAAPEDSSASSDSNRAESKGGWTPPLWNPPKDPGPIWSPSVWPPPTGSLPVGDAITISFGGGSPKRRLKVLSGSLGGRRYAGKRERDRTAS